MKTKLFLLSMLLTASAYAEMYKWVDANGKVTYSDMPPPASARQSQKKALSTDGAESGLPYSLASLNRDHPVILYSASQCGPCDDGRALLKNRGIPFSEKSIATNSDMAALKQAGGDGRLPYLSVGSTRLNALNAQEWNNALTAAGYPESSRLPGNYRFPQAQPAAATTPSSATTDTK